MPVHVLSIIVYKYSPNFHNSETSDNFLTFSLAYSLSNEWNMVFIRLLFQVLQQLTRLQDSSYINCHAKSG